MKEHNENNKIYSLGECPFCNGQGVLRLANIGGVVKIVCDEAYHVFDSMKDVEKKQLSKTSAFDKNSGVILCSEDDVLTVAEVEKQKK